MAIRLTADVPPSLAFALLPQPGEQPSGAADRADQLETHLLRIAGELRAAGFLNDVNRLPSVAEHPQLNALSSRQWQILARLMRGDRVPSIARELHLGQSTVRNYLSDIFARFDVHSQAELLALLRPED